MLFKRWFAHSWLKHVYYFRFEGQKCDKKDAVYKHGHCGDGLECRSFGDDDICQCVWEEIICGSDGVTYK